MSTLANITSLNLSLQTGGAALAVKAVKSVAKPERVVYVFGTADDVAPNFTTVADAITYANSLTPIVTEPVVIRLFTKADGTPYDLAGLSSWTTYANQYIYFVSDFVRLNETTTLPATLPAGQQIWYIDPNGVETLWVGREDGSAWPAVGYKEFVFDSNSGTATYINIYSDTLFGGSPPALGNRFSNTRTITSDLFTSGNVVLVPMGALAEELTSGNYLTAVMYRTGTTVYLASVLLNTNTGAVAGSNNASTFAIRIYP
jgi:hypothetical protein